VAAQAIRTTWRALFCVGLHRPSPEAKVLKTIMGASGRLKNQIARPFQQNSPHAPAMKPPAQHPSKVSQIIEDRYIDEDKLLDICKQRFGLGNYRLRVRVILSSYTAPKLLQLMFYSSSSTNGTSRLPQNSMRYGQSSCSLRVVLSRLAVDSIH
jgi:hypothetical protein